MKKHIFIILLLIVFTNAKSQIISNLVFDKETKKGIPYVSVWLKSTTFGTYSNEYGLFNLDIKNNKISDTLVLSCIGYKDLSYKISNKVDTIYLNPSEETLSEVVVKANKNAKKYNEGYHKMKAKSGFMGYNGCILVVFIPNLANIDKRIINIIIPFRKTKNEVSAYFEDTKETHKIIYKGEGRFRIKLYRKSISSLLPDEEINISNKIYHVDDYKKNIVISLEDENLFMPKEGFFAGIEWLDTNTTTKQSRSTKPSLKCTYEIKKNLMFTKSNFSNSKIWEVPTWATPEFRKIMNLPVATPNLMVGFELSD